MDGIEERRFSGIERRPSSEGASRSAGVLDGDWSEGVPGPAYAHGVPPPEPIGLPSERETTAPIEMAEAGEQPAAEPAVEAPADWGVAAEQAAEQAPVEAEVEAEVPLDEDFPITLSEADEIQEETTAPIDLAPGEDTAPVEEAGAPAEETPAPIEEPPAAPVEDTAAPGEETAALVEEIAAPVEEPPPTQPAEAEAADWLAHPDAAAAEPEAEAPATDGTPAATWEEATYGDSNLESAFAAAEAAQAPDVVTEADFAADPAPTASGALDAWGEPTVPPTASSEVEPWAAPVDTPWAGNEPVEPPPEEQKPLEIASPGSVGELTEEPPEPDWQSAAEKIAPPAAAGELTEEPPEPDWAKGPRELFSPLASGETLSDDSAAAAVEPARNTPPQLELVRGPEPLEDPDLLVPVEDATPPMGVPPVEASPALVVPGEQRVAIHMRAGQTKRGTVTDLDLSQPQVPLEPQGGGPTENIAHDEVKAIFFMLAPGEKAEAGPGQAIRVTFSDGRSIEGHRQGDESREGFFLVPLDAQRTNTRRIYVARDAVSEIVDLAQ